MGERETHPSCVGGEMVARLERKITPPRDKYPGKMSMRDDDDVGVVNLVRSGSCFFSLKENSPVSGATGKVFDCLYRLLRGYLGPC